MTGTARVALILLGVVAVGACGSGSPAGPRTVRIGGDTVPASRLAGVMDGLCEERRLHSDVVAARSAFYNRAHETVHLLARAVERRDRGAAARLLVAKQRVEADLSATAETASLADDLDRLTVAARAALTRLAISTHPCQKDARP